MGLGQSLRAEGHGGEEPLREARNMFAAMGAKYRVRRCDELLGEVSGAQSAS